MGAVKVFVDSANHEGYSNVLHWFAQSCGGEVVKGMYQECDVAVFFGSWKDRSRLHHRVKQSIVKNAKKFICLEMPLLGRHYPLLRQYEGYPVWQFRVGVGGFLADTSKFHNGNCPNDKWKQIQRELDVEIEPWSEGEYILIGMQLPGDASLRGQDIYKWSHDTVKQVREITKRPIVIRTHSSNGNKVLANKNFVQAVSGFSDVSMELGTFENKYESVKNAHCTITYSSGFGVDSVVLGTPAFATDTGSFARGLGNDTFDNIETPVFADRTQWINDLSYTQWSMHDIQNGKCWSHLEEIM